MLAPRWPSLTLAICLSLAFVGIARSPAYAAAGDLDPTFGGTGKVTTQFGPYWVDSANSVLVQPDGRIIAVGLSASCSCDYRFALARYNVDGTLDTTFGSAGLVRTRVRQSSDGYAAALQPDGKIVAVGYSVYFGGVDFAVVRYNPDGTLDKSFGKVTTDIGGGDKALAVAIQSDGKIVVAGSITYPDGTSDFALARYRPNGRLDTRFGIGGKVTTDLGGSDEANTVVVLASGKIVAGGSVYRGGNDGDFALARYNPDGSLSSGFGVGGKVTTDFAGGLDGMGGLLVQADGKIVAAGSTSANGDGEFALARYEKDGSLDPGFGSGGEVTTAFPGFAVGDAVALQPDGSIVAAGLEGIGNS